MPCFSATTASLSPVPLAPPSVVSLLGILIGELEGKLIGTSDTASVYGQIAPGGVVIGPLVGVLKTYASDSAGTAGGVITTVSGGSITSVFSVENKAPPGDSAAMIFRFITSVLDAMFEFC